MRSGLRRTVPLVALLLLPLAAVAEEGKPEGGAPAPAPAPAKPPGDAKPPAPAPAEPPKLRADPRARALLEKADARIYYPVDAGLKTLNARIVAESPRVGILSGDLEFTAPDALAVRAAADVPEALRGDVQQRLTAAAWTFVRRKLAVPTSDSHMDYREEDGHGVVVFETATGPAAGQVRLLRFHPETGLPTTAEIGRGGRVVRTLSQAFELRGDRWRPTVSTLEERGRSGQPVRTESRLEWIDAGGIDLPVRVAQRNGDGSTQTMRLESLVVNGKPVPLPKPAPKDPKEKEGAGATPAPAKAEEKPPPPPPAEPK